jgi:hypothetical protein
LPASASLSTASADPVIAMIAEEERLRDIQNECEERVLLFIRAQPRNIRPTLYEADNLPEPIASVEREGERCEDAAQELAMRIEATKPATVAGAAAMLKWATVNSDDPVVDNVIAGLADIVAKGAAA